MIQYRDDNVFFVLLVKRIIENTRGILLFLIFIQQQPNLDVLILFYFLHGTKNLVGGGIGVESLELFPSEESFLIFFILILFVFFDCWLETGWDLTFCSLYTHTWYLSGYKSQNQALESMAI